MRCRSPNGLHAHRSYDGASEAWRGPWRRPKCCGDGVRSGSIAARLRNSGRDATFSENVAIFNAIRQAAQARGVEVFSKGPDLPVGTLTVPGASQPEMS